jgi:hypothetical protein
VNSNVRDFPVESVVRGDDELGSLAQSARGTSLNRARGILIAIGVLQLLAGIFMFFNVKNEARQAIEAERQKLQPGMVIDPEAAKEAEETIIRVGQVVYGGTIVLGFVFIVLGVVVYKAPVACTVTGLILYVAANAIFAVFDPVSLLRGIIVKVIIVVGMVKSIQAAMAYEHEAREEREAGKALEEQHDDRAD